MDQESSEDWRDESEPGPSRRRQSQPERTPLHRGAACQPCKDRKVKCGAEKPICQRCASSLSRECVYMPLKSLKGEVQMMKRKIHELESQLGKKGSPHMTKGTAHTSRPGIPWLHPQNNSRIEHEPSSLPFSSSTGLFRGILAASSSCSTGPTPPHGGSLEYPDIPDTRRPSNSGEETTNQTINRPRTSSTRNDAAESSRRYGTGFKESGDERSDGMEFLTFPEEDFPQTTGSSFPRFSPLSIPSMLQQTNNSSQIPLAVPATTPSPINPNPRYPSPRTSYHQLAPTNQDSLPPMVRDHLLQLYFEKKRIYGAEMHNGRFFAAMQKVGEGRPHSCLLNGMYLVSCRFSHIDAVRRLEPHFAKVCAEQIDLAVGLSPLAALDLIRACCMLATWYYSEGEVAVGYAKVGIANRIAKGCGLHNIASNTFESALPAQSHRRARERSRTRFIGPPQDAIELGERIWTFWELVLLNYGGDYSFDFEPSWKKEEIRTPFPMPMLAYEPTSGIVMEDTFLIDLLDPKKRQRLAIYDDFTVTLIKAMFLLQECQGLYWLPQEMSTSFTVPTENDSGQQRFPARLRTPRATFDMEQALLRFEQSLKGVLRDFDRPIQAGITSMQPEEAFLCLAIGLARIEICCHFESDLANTEALRIGRRLIEVVHLMGTSKQDGFSTPLFVVFLVRLSRIFAMELERLGDEGDMEEITCLKSEMAFVLAAIQDVGRQARIKVWMNAVASLAAGIEDPSSVEFLADAFALMY